MGSPGWSFRRRVGFRFGLLAGALWVFPFPLGHFPSGVIPKTEQAAELLAKPWDWIVGWFARNALGLAELSIVNTGSSDRVWNYVQLLGIAILATLGTIVWSIVDRRRRAYPRLAAGAWIVLRYYVASALLCYGFLKILRLQFPDLTPGWLDRRVGEMSPMGLLWTFMSYSRPYTMFAGTLEAIGGTLLLWRRTTAIGALIVVAAMTNVVVLNLCYDVSAKLYSLKILTMAIVIALPSARRIIAAAAGRPTAGVPSRPRMSPRAEQVRRIAKLAMLGAITYNLCFSFRDQINQLTHPHELYGTWIVDSFVADGVEHPPLMTDPDRWLAISANSTRLWIAPMTGGHEGGELEVDARNQMLLFKPDRDTQWLETWSYMLAAPDRLVIDAVHGGKHLHVMLHPELPPPLVTRGFHWINERPFMR
jgi:uncharacterized membrane protein YphA (DoxX/SURF4 family)